MEPIERLERAVLALKESISGFPIGAVTLDDCKSDKEKIRDQRQLLTCLNSRLETLRVNTNYQAVAEPTEERNELLDQVQQKLASCLISTRAVTACLNSEAAQDIVFNKQWGSETCKHLKAITLKLYTLNTTFNTLVEELDGLSTRELQLKDDCQQLTAEYHDFLKEQSALRTQKLGQLHPDVAEKNEKQRKYIFKINIMKRLITTFISAGGSKIHENLQLQELLQKHRDLVTIDTILEMSKHRMSHENED